MLFRSAVSPTFLTTSIENPGLITMTTHILCLHLSQDERGWASNTCPG